MRSRDLGQNFLRNKRTARRLVHLADGPRELLCVDLGAGTGAITEAAVGIRTGPILAIEYDDRLVARLTDRYRTEPRVTVRAADLLVTGVPSEPFVIAANPPFNTSTKLIRRWLLAPAFVSGALIAELPFARRVTGSYGSTKLSLALAPYLDLAVANNVRAAEFAPPPSVATVIMTAVRRPQPLLPSGDSADYWMFVNYLFERGSRTVGESLRPLDPARLPAAVRQRPLRELDPESAVAVYAAIARGNDRVLRRMAAFEDDLPGRRRSTVLFGA